MRYLCLSGCGHLTDATLSSLSQHCPQLATLEVARCSLFTDLGFQALARVKDDNLTLYRSTNLHYSPHVELSHAKEDGPGRMCAHH